MTRQDFEQIARVLNASTKFAVYAKSAEVRSHHALTCAAMATDLSISYARFDRARFLKACGLDDETIENI